MGELRSTGSSVGASRAFCAVTFRGSIEVLAWQDVETGKRGLHPAEHAECLVQIGEPQ